MFLLPSAAQNFLKQLKMIFYYIYTSTTFKKQSGQIRGPIIVDSIRGVWILKKMNNLYINDVYLGLEENR